MRRKDTSPLIRGANIVSTQEPVNSGFRPDGAAEDGSTELADRIARAIRRDGPMTFRTFMQRALYEPGQGYYARPHTAWAEDGDFVTAPQVDAAFGVAVSGLASECDARLGHPSRFDLVEFGGGDGALLRDTCDAIERTAPALYERLRAYSIEQGGAAREQQRRTLARHAPRVEWLEDSSALEPASLQGLVISNELLDALPVHRVVGSAGGPRELYVENDGDGFVERPGELSDPGLRRYMDDNGISLDEGQVAEICLAVTPWITAVARILRRGFVLTVDYGAETSSLYGAGRPEGSLVCQYRYQLSASPFERIGRQDITAHVDLGNLRRAGEEVGLAEIGTLSLAAFLVGFGAAADAALPADGDAPSGDKMRRHLGLRHLLFTEIGDAHRAVLQAKDAEPIDFSLDRLG